MTGGVRLLRTSAEGVRTKALLWLAGLAILAYLPVFVQPFVSDDYLQIHLARKYGPVSGWAALAQDPLYRSRATSLVLTYWTEQLFGFFPLAFYSTSVAFHILNTWLVYCLGAWRAIGWRLSGVAAAFFAVHEGHQEAVMWYAALPELLVFLFVMLCLALWIRWVESPRWWLYAGALASFLAALASKESAVVAVALLLLPLSAGGMRRRRMLWLAPFAALALVYGAIVFASQAGNLHFNDDGTFSVHSPVWVTWANSYWRLLWIWGVISLAALAAWRARERWPVVALGLVWVALTLLPYSFVLYMTRVPSRHTYLPSVGLALLVAAGFLAFRERVAAPSRWAAAALAAAILAHNVGYLWIKKRNQFLDRAAPSEALIKMARQADRPIYMHCFRYAYPIAELAVEMAAGKPATILRWRRPPDSEPAAVYCLGLYKRCSQQVKPDPRVLARQAR